MSDERETHERDTAQPGDTEENTKDSGDRPLIPDSDAGPNEAAKYSRDEQEHGRQDYGP